MLLVSLVFGLERGSVFSLCKLSQSRSRNLGKINRKVVRKHRMAGIQPPFFPCTSWLKRRSAQPVGTVKTNAQIIYLFLSTYNQITPGCRGFLIIHLKIKTSILWRLLNKIPFSYCKLGSVDVQISLHFLSCNFVIVETSKN